MFERLHFYIRHSLNDLRVNRQRSFFALLCIAAGVAAIVSLQTVGTMIDDSLSGSLQESNRGDLRIIPGPAANESGERQAHGGHGGFRERANGRSSEELALIQEGVEAGILAEGGRLTSDYFTLEGVETLRAWLAANTSGRVEITYKQAPNSVSAGQAISTSSGDLQKTFITPFIIDAQQYPLYGERRTENGQLLSEVLHEPTDIVLSRNLADELGVEVGDTVRLTGATADFTVQGIISTETEGGVGNLFTALFGYYFLDLRSIALFDDIQPGADTLYVKLENPGDVEVLGDKLVESFPYTQVVTTADVEEQNSEVSSTLNQLVTVMGLVSLLIGGIGIVNTMLVIVSRRTTEVAVLKAIGLEAAQITTLFLVEAVLMGIVGSLMGVVLGWVGGYVIKSMAEAFLAQSLTYRLALRPALTGFVVGVVVTAIFGFIPTLAAGQVRPNMVLRPSDTVIPRAGRGRSSLALIVVIVVLSIVAQTLIGEPLEALRLISVGVGVGLGLVVLALLATEGIFTPRLSLRNGTVLLACLLGSTGFGFFVPALLVLIGSFMVMGILYSALWGLIIGVGTVFPMLKIPELVIAMRAMVATRARNASTLLALVTGVFTLSLITMLTSAVSDQFETMLLNEVGGNVIVLTAAGDDTLQQVNNKLDTLEGVESYSSVESYSVRLIRFDDQSTGESLDAAALEARVEEASPDRLKQYLRTMQNLDARSVDSNLPDVDLYAGRQLNSADAGSWDIASGNYPPMVISANDGVLAAGIGVGDLLTFEFGSGDTLQTITFEVVGMVDRTGEQLQVNFGSENYVPRTALESLSVTPDTVSAVVNIDEDQIKALRQSLRDMPGVFVMETRSLNELVNRVINQFSSFPMIVAALALVVGGIVIANSVALSTMERRREIAIMKAVGLQRERVLGMLLMEYGIMGFIGGVIGVGIGGIGLILLVSMSFGARLSAMIPYTTTFALLSLCVAITLIAALFTSWNASGEKPLMVLRYE